jgi:hypothetical protein
MSLHTKQRVLEIASFLQQQRVLIMYALYACSSLWLLSGNSLMLFLQVRTCVSQVYDIHPSSYEASAQCSISVCLSWSNAFLVTPPSASADATLVTVF